ncbi:MAG: 1-acyl-sn-glycerol-3-phosphate acyltransferase [Chloroflexi bacterium]|nr:1-acyl-sn-glycerol-3-phosphate acyltransferase [Chloroflexota bacterium]
MFDIVAKQRTVFGMRVEQPAQPSWLVAINKLWVVAICRWHSLEVSGKFPRTGPVLLLANHASWMDPVILAEAVTSIAGRTISVMTRSEFFETPLLGWWLRRSGGIAIRRGEADLAGLRRAREELRQGHVLGMFPQATRAYGRQGLFGEIKSGPAYIAARTSVPVVPTAILGSAGSLFSRVRYEVRFGEPFVVPSLARRASQPEVEERTRLVEERMLAVLPDSYKRDRRATA